ncbi:cysteine desulfurase family protein [Asticcacaulis sp. BYS171W]|uniref:Cysteine desulfurase n=1 Tax=Asticcacaulis aquaticus TaxID=2984212 RepID=A0ABT5HP05_9CAUL|nr:cysteine desulfurase family protein [Asticcacaulis aquaticus]MDC7681713.1 cysteine desulfurase family protein [Asticcacaulis aquaticus]
MSRAPIYLDHAATSPIRPEVRDAMIAAWDIGANASSVHALGRKAKLLLEEARDTVLGLVNGVGPARLVFTSGGTEANQLALAQARGFDRIIVSAGEHDSLHKAAESYGLPVAYVPLLRSGLIDLAALDQLLIGRPFVAVMLVNNETGVIKPIRSIAEKVHAAGGWLHVDAVQAAGKIDIDIEALGADSLSLAAHKIGGPQGVGALVYSADRDLKAAVPGGGQEFGHRAGTENIAGISGFAAAVRVISAPDTEAQIATEAALKALGATIVGEDAPRAPGITCFTVPDWTAQLQLIHMDMAGICVSSGSACSSGKVKSSRVLEAMGLNDVADKALRVSSGWNTTPVDWQEFLDIWSKGYEKFLARQTSRVKESA